MPFSQVIIIRGGGDLATGVAARLAKSGFRVIVTELEKPMSVRRKVSCSEAVYDGSIQIEDISILRVDNFSQAFDYCSKDKIPVLIDPNLKLIDHTKVSAVIDARLLKRDVSYNIAENPLIIGLGPNFFTGRNCHYAVETERGHDLGKVIRNGGPRKDTGVPEGDPRRVLRAHQAGYLKVIKDIGAHVEADETVALINGSPVKSILSGMIRGMIHDDSLVSVGVKIGDVDPRDQRKYCFTISDKAFAVGGGVLEALLSAWSES